MSTPQIGAVASSALTLASGGSPRTQSIAIGEPTPGQHRCLVIWTNAGQSTDTVTGVTAGGAAMTALGAGGAGTAIQHTPFIVRDPGTDGSGNCLLSLACSGDGAYTIYLWWAVVDDVQASGSYTDLTAAGALTGSSTAPSSGAQTVPAGGFLLAGMSHNFSSSYSLAGSGSTQHLAGSITSKPMAIASRITSGAIEWSTNSSNVWYVSAILFEASAADTTAPTLTSPTGVATGSTTATVGATTDEGNGTLHAVVTTSATQPSAAQIVAGQSHTGAGAPASGSLAISSTGAKTINVSGLTASTAYYAHLVHVDAAANQSAVASSASFSTPASPALAGAASGSAAASGALTVEGIPVGFAFSTAAGLEFGAIVGALTGVARETAGAQWSLFVRADGTDAAVCQGGPLSIDSAGRLPDFTHAALVAGTTYFVRFRRDDGAWAAARLVAEELP